MENFATMHDATIKYIDEMKQIFNDHAVAFNDPGDPKDFVDIFNAIANIWYNEVPTEYKTTKIPQLSTDNVTVADAFYRMIEVLTWIDSPDLLPDPIYVNP